MIVVNESINMKTMKHLLAVLPLAAVFATGSPLRAEDKKTDAAKPYPLTTCVVSDEKLGGDHGKPHVFTHEGREIKLCCKSCLKDFKKDPAKYVKKIEEAEAKAKK